MLVHSYSKYITLSYPLEMNEEINQLILNRIYFLEVLIFIPLRSIQSVAPEGSSATKGSQNTMQLHYILDI